MFNMHDEEAMVWDLAELYLVFLDEILLHMVYPLCKHTSKTNLPRTLEVLPLVGQAVNMSGPYHNPFRLPPGAWCQ